MPAKLRGTTNLLAKGPNAQIIGGNFDDGGQKEIQVHVAPECWSTEEYTVVHHCIHKPINRKRLIKTISTRSWSSCHPYEEKLTMNLCAHSIHIVIIVQNGGPCQSSFRSHLFHYLRGLLVKKCIRNTLWNSRKPTIS